MVKWMQLLSRILVVPERGRRMPGKEYLEKAKMAGFYRFLKTAARMGVSFVPSEDKEDVIILGIEGIHEDFVIVILDYVHSNKELFLEHLKGL